MKILIEESVLRQALEHIEYVANIGTSMSRDTCHYLMDESRKEATALRTALDAAEKVEPVVRVWVGKVDGTDCRGIEFADMPEESAWNWMRLEDGEHDLYAHPAPAVPEGWVLVPKEPTDEMLVAAWNSARFGRSPKEDTSVWKAMLAASPKPEEEK